MLGVACSSLRHDSSMDLTAEAEGLAIDPKLLAQLENLEGQCNPDFECLIAFFGFHLKVKGVTGASIFCIHTPFDLVKGTVVDGLHTLVYGLCFCVSFTGSEMRSWILFYSFPDLLGVLPQPFFSHLTLLVAALHILWADKIIKTVPPVKTL